MMRCESGFARRLVVLVMGFLLPALFVGHAQAKVHITVWHALSAEKSDIFAGIAQGFFQANPDIEVDIIRIGSYTEIFDKVQVAYAGGAAPNIAMFEQARTQSMAENGALLPLDSFLAADGIRTDDFYPALLDFVTLDRDGKIYGIPYNTSTLVNYYNRDLFESSGLGLNAPKTWQEYANASIRIARDRNGDGKQDVWGMDLYSMGWQFENWLGQNGARVLSPDGKRFTLNSPEAVEAMAFLQDLIYYRRVGVALSQSKGYDLFWNSQLGMAARSTATVKANELLAKDKFNMGIAAMPCNKECYVSIGGANFSLLKTGTPEEQKAAWKFLSYMSSTDALAQFAASSGYMAARRSSVQSKRMRSVFAEDPFMSITYLQLEYAHPRPKVPMGNLYDNELTAAYKPLFSEGRNPKTVLDQMAQRLQIQLDEILKR